MSNKYPPRPNLVYQIGEDVSDANGIAELAIRHLVSQQGISAKLSNLLEALDDQQQAADRQLRAEQTTQHQALLRQLQDVSAAMVLNAEAQAELVQAVAENTAELKSLRGCLYMLHRDEVERHLDSTYRLITELNQPATTPPSLQKTARSKYARPWTPEQRAEQSRKLKEYNANKRRTEHS